MRAERSSFEIFRFDLFSAIFTAAAMFATFLLNIPLTSAQEGDTTVGVGSLENARKEVMKGNGDEATIDRDGRDLNLGGYERSPILFDPLQNDTRVRVYPQLTAQKEYSRQALYQSTICTHQELFPPELRDICEDTQLSTESTGVALVQKKSTSNMLMTNLMVDDEIHKAEMGIFWDPEYLRNQYLNDPQQLESYLSGMNSPQGVGGMALDFLDKAVAASTASTRQHADTNTMLQFIRQVNLNTSQIANPERVQLYKDHAEKFEACMYTQGEESQLSAADGSYGHPMFKHVNFTLPESLGGGSCLSSNSYCRKLYSGKIDGATTKGLYQFCMCCADKVLQMNDSTTNQVEDSSENSQKEPYKKNLCDEYLGRLQNDYNKRIDIKADGGSPERMKVSYSLVERVFMGLTYRPESGASSGSSGSWDDPTTLRTVISNFAHFFQDVYGDVCYYETVSADNTRAGFIRKQFVSPYWSVPQLVDLMRNGKPDEVCERSTQYCPITAEEVKVGICPAFKLLVAMEYKGELHKALSGESTAIMTKADVENYWIQATLGDTLTARDFQNVVRNFQKHPEFNRFIETFCDASAGAAVKKMHSRMMSIALDHLLLNQKISDEDRKMVRRLMDRVSDYIGLAAQDSSSMANSMVIASEVQRNRLDQADRGSFVASALGASRNSAQMDELDAPFGGAAPSSALLAATP